MQQLVIGGAQPEEAPELRGILEADEGWSVRWLASLYDLSPVMEHDAPHLALAVVHDRTSLRFLEALAERRSRADPPVPLMAVFLTEPLEAELQRLRRTVEFVIAPLRPLEVRARLRRLLAAGELRRTSDTAARVSELFGLEAVLGEDPVFMSVKARLVAIARAEAAVLITGETGTGKEVVARAIHYLSRRAHRPFLPVDCGAIPTELFENEFFGHRRGAFTDARHAEPGLIAEAEGGTLFLDEVDAIPLLAQTKLLRFLQHQTYRPLGQAAMLRANVRVVAATNADLERCVKEGTFRQDLFYRLNIIPVALPPLRDRPGDIALLARHFLEKYTSPRSAWELAPGFVRALQAYRWPGNVRELENLIQQIVAVSPPGTLGLEVLPAQLCAAPAAAPASTSFRNAKARAVAAFEREYARGLLSEYRGNITKAARAAGTDRRVLGRLVKKHGVKAVAGPRMGPNDPGAG